MGEAIATRIQIAPEFRGGTDQAEITLRIGGAVKRRGEIENVAQDDGVAVSPGGGRQRFGRPAMPVASRFQPDG